MRGISELMKKITPKNIPIDSAAVDKSTLAEVLKLAVELAREGREGRKVGSIFVVSDEKKTLGMSRCMILDPLSGHPPEKKSISDVNMRETVKELAQLDGAFIVSNEGIFISACRYLYADSSGVDVPLGLGSRHIAAAAITKASESAAVVVSENSAVRVFYGGKLVSEISSG